jgi:hypothetical protein
MDSFYVTGSKLLPKQEFNNGVEDKLYMYVSSATFGYLFQFEYIQNVMSLGDPIDRHRFGINYPLDNTSLNPSLIHFPTYLIKGHTYYNVLKLYSTNVITQAYEDWYFFSYQTGIIKMTLTKAADSSIRVWELQRCHIEQ